MKKYLLVLLTLFLLSPLVVFAINPNVKTVEATSNGATITYNGTTEGGSVAVMCKLYLNSQEKDLFSAAVENNEFSGQFIVKESGEYTVSCANYESGTIISDSVSVNITETYTVTFNSNEGSAVEEQHILDGSNAVVPEDPTRDGYTFLGWYEDDTLTTIFDFTKQITKNTTLYAKWEDNNEPQQNTYTVTFNTNGGGEFDPAFVNEGDLVPLPGVGKDGYVFVGWYEDDTFTSEFDPNTQVDGDLTLYARWNKLITFANANITVPFGGDHPDFNIVSSNGQEYSVQISDWYLYESPSYPSLDGSSYFEAGKDYALRVTFIANENYEFANDIVFNINNETTSCYGSTGDREIIFYNIKGPIMHAVSFSTGEETGFGAMINDGDLIERPQDPEKEGFRFIGWYNETLTEEFDFNTPIEDDITIYAKWEEVIRDEDYTAIDEDGNKIEFKEESGKTFKLTMMDVVPLNDTELEEKVGINREQYNQVKGAIEEEIKEYGDLVAFYDIIVEDTNSGDEIHTGPFKIKIKMTDEMKKYDVFKLAYVKNDFSIEEPIELTIEGDYLVGTLPHLSAYVLIGDNAANSANPYTYDNIMMWVGILIISIIGMAVVTVVALKKRKA